MQSAFSLAAITYSSVSKLEGQLRQAPPDVVIFSLMQSDEASINALKVLLEFVPTVPVIVLEERAAPLFNWTQPQIVAIETQKVEGHKRGLRSAALRGD